MDHEFRSAEEWRAAIVALTQKETGIDESMIETLVRAFYARVRKDELLAPIFETRISDWGPHLESMFGFWSSLTLQTGRYHGQSMAKHMPLAVDAVTSTDGLRCSRKRRATFARRPRQKNSSTALAASRRAWSSASQAPTAFSLSRASAISAKRDRRDHLSEKSVSSTFPLSPMTHTSVCGLVVLVRST